MRLDYISTILYVKQVPLSIRYLKPAENAQIPTIYTGNSWIYISIYPKVKK